MKSNSITKPIVLAIFCLATMWAGLSETRANTLWQADIPMAEEPKTAAEKLKDLQSHHKNAFDRLTAGLNRLPVESEFLGSKELFNMVDESTREMKRIRSRCATLMSSLRAEAKKIKSSSSFSEEQKQELLESAETLANDCEALSKALDLAVTRLGTAYTIFPKWNQIHKSYRNLKGEAKASEVIKSNVEEYLSSFTPEAEDAFEGETAEGEELSESGE